MTQLSPINYKIHLEPDLRRFTFSATTEILVHAPYPVAKITLNSLELAVRSCQAFVEGAFSECPFRVDPQKEALSLFLPRNLSGQLALRIHYQGEINDKMAGFYRSRYKKNGQTAYMAVTQFEESDARRAFPCFDRPDKKATFDIEMVIDQDLVALSNGRLVEERPLPEGKKQVGFQQTPKMSTYLLFFAVGDFEFSEDPGSPVVRAATLPGMTPYAQFGLDFGRKALEFCQDYYGVPYPFSKLDLIAIPDFAFGAMENWGAITFRENLLLHYPGTTSQAAEEGICETIAHEIVHQWFGNLVTPSDWRYLWLNESFATYFGYGIVDHYFPEWGIWDQFINGRTDKALDRDALCHTFAIEIPGGEHVVINASTAPIIYSKGASVLRQMALYLGEEGFKKGLRAYLAGYAYGCASSRHLWESFEEATEKPITRIMKSWVEKAGHPLLSVKKEGTGLRITQEKFTYLDRQSPECWLVPVTVRFFYEDGHSEWVPFLLENETHLLEMDERVEAYKVNDGQSGFYRVKYLHEKDLRVLGRYVLENKLPCLDRWGLQNDLYALVKKGDVSIDEYLEFLSFYKHEEAYLPITSIAQNLLHAYLVLKEPQRERVCSFGRTFLEKILFRLGYEPRSGEEHTLTILRDQIMWDAVLYGSESTEKQALDKFSRLLKGESIHPDLMKSILRVAAFTGEHKTFEWLKKRFDSVQSEHERINILVALGSFGEKDLIKRAQAFTLEKVPARNRFMPVLSMATNPGAIPYLWDWYREGVETFERFHPLHYERVIEGVIPLAGLGREEEVFSFFDRYKEQKILAKDTIALSLEKLRINAGMRRRLKT